jgi:hypothetical protein
MAHSCRLEGGGFSSRKSGLGDAWHIFVLRLLAISGDFAQ